MSVEEASDKADEELPHMRRLPIGILDHGLVMSFVVEREVSDIRLIDSPEMMDIRRKIFYWSLSKEDNSMLTGERLKEQHRVEGVCDTDHDRSWELAAKKLLCCPSTAE